jgi:predicted nucleic acid-binding Zn ribbon protein
MQIPLASGASESRLRSDEKRYRQPVVPAGFRAVNRGENNRPELLKEALQRQIRRLGIARQVAGGRIVAGWSDVVGPKLAAKTEAVAVENGVLTVAVPEAAWRQELTLQKAQLIARLNAAVEEKVIRDIFFVAVSRRKDRG